MDYLVNEGYPSAAKNFAVEANISPMPNPEQIRERVAVMNAIHSGDIQTAIERINEINPQVCSDPQLSLRDPQRCYDYTMFSCTTHISFGMLMKNKTPSVLSMSNNSQNNTMTRFNSAISH